MKLPDIILLSGSVAFFIIGVHQVMTVGFANAYWAIMLAVVLFFVFNLRKKKNN